jgi:hypothetical protein
VGGRGERWAVHPGPARGGVERDRKLMQRT